MKLFSGSANKPLAKKIADLLGKEISPVEVFVFPDGERRIRILDSVVDEDVILVQSTTTPADINYMELFFIADGLRRSGAKSITAVIPYVGYQRQDHVFRDGEAVSLEVIIRTLEAVGVDKVITLDLHSVRITQTFNIPVSHLSAVPLFAQTIKDNGWNTDESVLVSPDAGGIRRVKMLSELLDMMPYAVVEKNRSLHTGKVEALQVAVEGGTSLNGKRALIVDDMITSSATVVEATTLLKEKGAGDIIVFATHGIFASGASKFLQDCPIEKVYVTDTVLIPETKKIEKMELLSVAEMIAEELKGFSI